MYNKYGVMKKEYMERLDNIAKLSHNAFLEEFKTLSPEQFRIMCLELCYSLQSELADDILTKGWEVKKREDMKKEMEDGLE